MKRVFVLTLLGMLVCGAAHAKEGKVVIYADGTWGCQTTGGIILDPNPKTNRWALPDGKLELGARCNNDLHRPNATSPMAEFSGARNLDLKAVPLAANIRTPIKVKPDDRVKGQ